MAGKLATQKAAEAFDTIVDFLESFESLEDPRQRGKVLYPLDEVLLLLLLLGVIAGCESWVEIARYGEKKLALLRRFFEGCPGTRLHLHFEAISGPTERLFDGEADLILHHIDKSDPRLEYQDLFAVRFVPVVAPGFLGFPISRSITPEQMRDYVQCVIRDSAQRSSPRDYYLIEGARSWTVTRTSTSVRSSRAR